MSKVDKILKELDELATALDPTQDAHVIKELERIQDKYRGSD